MPVEMERGGLNLEEEKKQPLLSCDETVTNQPGEQVCPTLFYCFQVSVGKYLYHLFYPQINSHNFAEMSFMISFKLHKRAHNLYHVLDLVSSCFGFQLTQLVKFLMVI